MANKPSMNHLRRGATALTAEAGKLIRDRALSAAHQALVMALQSVQAADRKLRGTVLGNPRRKAVRRGGRASAAKRKPARPAAKARSAMVASRPRHKRSRNGRRVAR